MFHEAAKLHFTYWPSFVTHEQAAIIADTFRQVLTEILREPSQRVSQLDFAGEKSKACMEAWNQSVPESENVCVHHIIQRQCFKYPNAQAVCAWDGNFSYLELDRLSSHLAKLLIDRGINPEMWIPLCFEKSRWVPVAIVGVLKAGAAFVPLDASHPEQRLRQVCQDVNAPIVLCSKKTSTRAASLLPWNMEIDTVLSSKMVNECRAPDTSVAPHNAAYTMFTSGSTSKPKGVVIEHSSLATSVKAFCSMLYIDCRTRMFQFASHAFDASILEIMGALCVGGCICIPSDDERREDIQGAVARMKVNWSLLTPTVARLLQSVDLPSLKTLVLGGEGLSKSDVETWSARLRLIQAYGPTECTITCAITHPLSLSSNPRSLGLPSGCCAWVVNSNDHNKLVPIGAAGELLVEGPVVGRGYINVIDQESGFIEAPSWLQAIRAGRAGRVYRTGDLVRHGLDGSLKFVGRNDTQAKLHGQRMELAELEYHVKETFPEVQQVIVEVVRPTESNRPAFLAAFILQTSYRAATERHTIPVSDLLELPSEQFHSDILAAEPLLHDRLPSYMVPTVFLPLSYVPTAATGKADRKALRNHLASLTRSQVDAYHPARAEKRMPSTLVESKLQLLLAHVLEIPTEDVGVDDNLFRLGVDSIGAMKLVAAARHEGLELSVTDIFQQPRLSDIGHAAKEIVRSAKPSDQAPSGEWLRMREGIASHWHIPISQVIDILPTTWFQRMYVRQNVIVYFVFDFAGLLDRAALRAAIKAIIQKHTILRTVFVPYHDTILQVALHDIDTELQELTTDNGNPASFTESICRQASQRPVGPAASRFQPTLVTANGARQSLILGINHALFDGASMPKLMEDLEAAYEGTPLAPPVGFPVYMKKRIEHNSLDRIKPWEKLLHGSSMTYLDPSVVEPPESNSLLQSSSEIPLPAISPGITMATVAKTAWAFLLSQETGSEDVVFGQTTHGRNLALEGIESVVGPCISLIPVRVTLHPGLNVQGLLEQVQNQHISMTASDTVDLNDIIEHCTSWPKNTQFGTVIHYQNIPSPLSYSFVRDMECTARAHQFNLHASYPYVVCTPSANSLRVDLSVSPKNFDQGTVDRMVKELGELILKLATHPRRRLCDIIKLPATSP